MKLMRHWSQLNRFRFLQLSMAAFGSLVMLCIGVYVFMFFREHNIITDAPADSVPLGESLTTFLIGLSPVAVSALASLLVWRACLAFLGFSPKELEGYPFYSDNPFPGVSLPPWMQKRSGEGTVPLATAATGHGPTQVKHTKHWSALRRFNFVQGSTAVVASVVVVYAGVRIFAFFRAHDLLAGPLGEFLMTLLIGLSSLAFAAILSVGLWKHCLQLLGFSPKELKGYPFYWAHPFPGVPAPRWMRR